jgi:thymidylate kinase
MASAELLRRQAARCAGLAMQTYDEESRQRCRRLEQTYLHLAEEEEQKIGRVNATIGGTESRHAT